MEQLNNFTPNKRLPNFEKSEGIDLSNLVDFDNDELTDVFSFKCYKKSSMYFCYFTSYVYNGNPYVIKFYKRVTDDALFASVYGLCNPIHYSRRKTEDNVEYCLLFSLIEFRVSRSIEVLINNVEEVVELALRTAKVYEVPKSTFNTFVKVFNNTSLKSITDEFLDKSKMSAYSSIDNDNVLLDFSIK